MFNTFQFPEVDEKKVDKVLEQFERYCHVVFERYQFWQITRKDSQTVDQLVTRLKNKAKSCTYESVDDMVRHTVTYSSWLIYSTLFRLILFDVCRGERLFWEIKCGVYQVQLFFCIFSQSFSISSISFFPGLDTGMSGIWPGTGLETFLLSCAMPLMIHNFLEPWCWLPQYTLVSYPFLSYSSVFSFICKLPFSTSWNSTLKSFKSEVIRDGCCCCFFLFSLSLPMVDVLFFYLNPLFFFLTPSFN